MSTPMPSAEILSTEACLHHDELEKSKQDSIKSLKGEIHSKDNSNSNDNWGIKEEEFPRAMNGHEPVYPLDDTQLAYELSFFKEMTGIKDEAELKSHILKIRDIAYKRYPYPCICVFDFLRPQTLAHPFYTHQVKKEIGIHGDERKIYVDFGPFIGTDLRQVLHDGWNKSDILGVDVTKEWEELGWQLFKDRHHAPPIFSGDIFKSSIFDVSVPAEEDHSKALDLRKMEDLNMLKGKVTFLSAFKVFHLFSEKDQRELAIRCGLLFSNKPGAAIFGKHQGAHEEKVSPHSSQFYTHSPISWKKLWRDVLGDKIEVKAEIQPFDSHSIFPGLDVLGDLHWMVWSVVRI